MTTKPRGATIQLDNISNNHQSLQTMHAGAFPPSDVALVCLIPLHVKHWAQDWGNIYSWECIQVLLFSCYPSQTSPALHSYKPNTPWQTRQLQRNWEFQGASGSCGLVWGWLSGRSSRVTVFVWLSTSSGVIGVGRTSSARGHYNITSALLTFQFPTHSLSPWPEEREREKAARVCVC